MNENEYFANKKTGWVKPENNPGRLPDIMNQLSLAFKTLIDADKTKLLETTERLKNVLEKSTSNNSNIR